MAGADVYGGFDEGDPTEQERVPSRLEIDDADVVLISPFESNAKRQFHRFRQRVIEPALDAARRDVDRDIRWVVLNGLVTGSEIDPELAYRLLHQADLCIADVTDCDHRALSFLTMRLSLSSGPAIALDRTLNRTAYPLPIDPIVENARPPKEGDVTAKLRMLIGNAVCGRAKKYLSPVFEGLEALNVNLHGSPVKEGEPPEYDHFTISGLTNSPRIAVAVGDIRETRGVDVWVNPENTQLEMARVFDTSISGTIRHMSSNWSNGRRLNDDYMRRQVAQKLPSEGVEPGFAGLTTCSGELKSTRGVKMVAHVAAVELKSDDPGCGYSAVRGDKIADCVTNVLEAVDDHNNSWRRSPLKTIIFPLIGSYASPNLAERNVKHMVDALLKYFLSGRGDGSQIEAVALLGYTDEDERLIRKAFQRSPELSSLDYPPHSL